MKKYKLSKSDEKWLRAEAKKLPTDYSATKEIQAISGEKLALSGIKRSVDAKPIDPNAVYAIKVPNIIPIKHTRRLLKLFAEEGPDAVHKYLDKYRVAEDKIYPVAPKEVDPVKPKTIFQKIRSKFTN